MRSTEAKSSPVSWTVPIVVAELDEGGQRVAVEASESERAEIARATGLRDLPKLTGTFELMPIGDRVRVTGEVDATVGQSCVVTLERVENAVREPVDLLFVPADQIAVTETYDSDEQTAEDPPEPIENGQIDLAKLAVEFLILGINPYPRKEGAVFERVHTPPAAEDHPFAGLAALKEPGNDGKTPAKPAESLKKRS